MKRRIIAIMAAVSIMTFGLVGCGSESPQSADAAEQGKNEESVELNGTIKLAGSTSMEKLCEAMSESFMEKNPGVTVTVEYTGSGAGLESLAAGSVDIGNASRGLKDEEKASGAVENIVAIDGIAVITNKSCSIKDVTSKDLAKIYTGEITDWAELGGEEQQIIVIGREAGSGTRDAFEELLEVKDVCAYAQELDSTGALLATVGTTPGAIPYVSLDVVDDTVSGLKIDGVEPTEEESLAGNYMLQRPFVMATKGEISEQNELVQTWFNYINSDDGKEVIKQVGLIIPQ